MMDAVRFTIPYPPTKKGKAAWNKRFSLNAYWSGKHYRQRSKDARDIHSLTILALRQARVRKAFFDKPVEIIFRWGDRLDVDNHAALGKMITDALKGYLLRDDSPRYFRRVVHELTEGHEIEVEVRVL